MDVTLNSGSGASARRAVNDVITLVSKTKNVPLRVLINRSRCRAPAARARQLAMYLSYVMLGRTLAEIGGVFGRDRTTVSHACALIEDMRDDPDFDAEVCRLESCIEAGRAQHEH